MFYLVARGNLEEEVTDKEGLLKVPRQSRNIGEIYFFSGTRVKSLEKIETGVSEGSTRVGRESIW